jgi:hypothetical protein
MGALSLVIDHIFSWIRNMLVTRVSDGGSEKYVDFYSLLETGE